MKTKTSLVVFGVCFSHFQATPNLAFSTVMDFPVVGGGGKSSSRNPFSRLLAAEVGTSVAEERPTPIVPDLPVVGQQRATYKNASNGKSSPGRYRRKFFERQREEERDGEIDPESLKISDALPDHAFYVGRDAEYEKSRYRPTTSAERREQELNLLKTVSKLRTGPAWQGPSPKKTTQTAPPPAYTTEAGTRLVDAPIEAFYDDAKSSRQWDYAFQEMRSKEAEESIAAAQFSAIRAEKAKRVRKTKLMQQVGRGSSLKASRDDRIFAMECPLEALVHTPGTKRTWPTLSEHDAAEMCGMTHLDDPARELQDRDIYACHVEMYALLRTFKKDSSAFRALAHRGAFFLTSHALYFVPSDPLFLVRNTSPRHALALEGEQIFGETIALLSSHVAAVVALGRKYRRNPYLAPKNALDIVPAAFLQRRKNISMSLAQWRTLLASRSIRPLAPKPDDIVRSVPCHFENKSAPILATPLVFLFHKLSDTCCVFLTLVLVNLNELRATPDDDVVDRLPTADPAEWQRHLILHTYFCSIFDVSNFARVAQPGVRDVPKINTNA